MKKYLLVREDDSVAILNYIGGKKSVEDIVKSMRYKVKDVKEIGLDDLPNDRIFRDAWVCSNGKVKEDTEKAKSIKRDHFRKLRGPLLNKLDIEYIRALEQGKSADASLVSRKKQVLRDITKVDLPNNIEELRNFLPKELKGE